MSESTLNSADSAQRLGRRRPQQTLSLPLGRREGRIIFKEMVRSELEVGLVRRSRRRRLQNFAEKLGLTPFETELIIAEVQHDLGQLEVPSNKELRPAAQFVNRSGSAVGPSYSTLMIVAGALILELWFVMWVF